MISGFFHGNNQNQPRLGYPLFGAARLGRTAWFGFLGLVFPLALLPLQLLNKILFGSRGFKIITVFRESWVSCWRNWDFGFMCLNHHRVLSVLSAKSLSWHAPVWQEQKALTHMLPLLPSLETPGCVRGTGSDHNERRQHLPRWRSESGSSVCMSAELTFFQMSLGFFWEEAGVVC